MNQPQETNFQTANKDPYMRVIIKIILTLLAAFLIILLFLISCGRHVNIWGLDINKKNDTIKINAPISVNNPDNLDSKSKQPISQKTNTGDNEVNSVYGDNNGIVGGKNNTINAGIKQRKLNQSKLDGILKQLPDTSTIITIVTLHDDAESGNYSTEIMNALKKIGYTKIHIQYDQSMSNKYDSFHIVVQDDKRYTAIMVYPVKNVKQ